jgi:leucine-rich repeat protein SHOC2
MQRVLTQQKLENIIAKAAANQWIELDLGSGGGGYIENSENLSLLWFEPLTFLPESIGKITSLQKLYLGCNQLEILPKSLAKLTNLQEVHLGNNTLTSVPEPISKINNLISLDLCSNNLRIIPVWIGKLTQLQYLNLNNNELTSLPSSISKLKQLISLYLSDNNLASFPKSICKLINLELLVIHKNQLTSLPDEIGQLVNLRSLYLNSNQLTTLPDSLERLINLTSLALNNNPLNDLSILQFLPKLETVWFLDVQLPRRYWTRLSEWQAKWLLDEDNSEIRKLLIQRIGYERICQELDVKTIDYWREYSLIKIDSIDIKPIVLLKMTCPSTGHIHILRVPPRMKNAQAAITWVNHGIHPDEFAVQT